MRAITAGLLILIVCILIIVLSGCYSFKKAKTQFGRASATYPELPADYCNRVYPCVDSLIKGDSVTVYDTLWGAGETIYDTEYINDTVYLSKVIIKPVTITKTVRVVDTIRLNNTAALDLCSIARDGAIRLAEDYKAEAEKWRKTAKNRFWIIAGIGAAGLLWLVLFIRRKASPLQVVK